MYKAFIENTIKPLIESTNEALKKCEKLGFSKEDIIEWLIYWGDIELRKITMCCLTAMILGIGFCFIIYIIFR